MPPRRLRPSPEERALRGPTRTAPGSISGRVESAAPITPPRIAAALAGAQSFANNCISEEFTWFEPGVLGTWASEDRWYPPFEIKLFSIHIAVDDVAVGSSIIVDIKKNGSSIFTSTSHRPKILAGDNTGAAVFIDDPDMALGDYLTFEITQVGSTTPGSNLAVTLGYLVCPSLSEPTGAVTGPCLNPDGPVPGVSGLVVWLKADCVLGADGDEVTSWPDSSGNGNTFVEGGSNIIVRFDTNQLNGLPGVHFDGGGQKYLTGPDLSGSLPTECTMFIVWALEGGGGNYFIFQDDDDFRDGYWASSGSGYFTPFRNTRIPNYPSAMPTDSAGHQLSLISSASTYRAWLDGADQGAQSPDYHCGNLPCFNKVATFLSSAFAGWVHEFLIYDSALGSTDRAAVESYLSAKWGI